MSELPTFHAGWDVGGWNCDKNARSRDAVVLLDSAGRVVGSPWRGNLRASIERAADGRAWVEGLFDLCGAAAPAGCHVTIGIDTPLGFSDALRQLLVEGVATPTPDASVENPYVYRLTERLLAAEGKTPLSPIKDMIGSQATKGMHAVAKFVGPPSDVGIWSNDVLTMFEAYPAVSRDHPLVRQITDAASDAVGDANRKWHDDQHDALCCAAVARLFQTNRDRLVQPGAGVSKLEGWIWRPRPTSP